MRFERKESFLLFGLTKAQSSWRGLKLLLGVYLGSLLFASLLAPPVYWAVQAWWEAAPNSLNDYLAYKGFEDYFDRLRWIPIVLALPWILKVTGMLSLQRLGLRRDPASLKRIVLWGLAGAALTTTIAVAQLTFGESSLRDLSAGKMIGYFFKGLAGGLALGLLEEIIFRGLVLRLFYTATTPLLALLLGSLFFSWTHFKMPDHVWRDAFPVEALAWDAEKEREVIPPDTQRVNWSSGFFVAFWTVIAITEGFQFVPFVNYAILGFLLGLLALRSGQLNPCMGFHAGVVCAMLTYKKWSEIPDSGLFLGGNKLVDGLLPICLLVPIILYLLLKPDEAPNKTLDA